MTTNSFLHRKNILQYCILYLCMVFLVNSCTKASGLKLQPVQTIDGWGYVISNHDKIVIRQQFIPVIAANKSFSSKEDALKAGGLVLSRIKKNASPTLTKTDLSELKIKY